MYACVGGHHDRTYHMVCSLLISSSQSGPPLLTVLRPGSIDRFYPVVTEPNAFKRMAGNILGSVLHFYMFLLGGLSASWSLVAVALQVGSFVASLWSKLCKYLANISHHPLDWLSALNPPPAWRELARRWAGHNE